MSDRERSHAEFLDLITRPGVVEVMVALQERDGTATIAELEGAGVGCPSAPLRALAAAGQIRRGDHGTWDTDPAADTLIALTEAGHGLARTLRKVCQWGRRNRPTLQRRGWWERLRIRRPK
jgi:DNA-binding HxlR family transcriptional regulator